MICFTGNTRLQISRDYCTFVAGCCVGPEMQFLHCSNGEKKFRKKRGCFCAFLENSRRSRVFPGCPGTVQTGRQVLPTLLSSSAPTFSSHTLPSPQSSVLSPQSSVSPTSSRRLVDVPLLAIPFVLATFYHDTVEIQVHQPRYNQPP